MVPWDLSRTVRWPRWVLWDLFQTVQYLQSGRWGLSVQSGQCQTVQCHPLLQLARSGLFRMVQYRRLGRLGQSGLFRMVQYRLWVRWDRWLLWLRLADPLDQYHLTLQCHRFHRLGLGFQLGPWVLHHPLDRFRWDLWVLLDR